MYAFPMRALLFPQQLGYRTIANGCSTRHGAIPGSILLGNDTFFKRVQENIKDPASVLFTTLDTPQHMLKTFSGSFSPKLRPNFGHFKGGGLEGKGCSWAPSIRERAIGTKIKFAG